MKKLFFMLLLALSVNTAIVAQNTYNYNVSYVECFDTKTAQLLETQSYPDLTITFKFNSQSTGRMILSSGITIYLNSYRTLYEGAFEYQSVNANNNSRCITKLYFSDTGLTIILIFNDYTFRYTAWVN